MKKKADAESSRQEKLVVRSETDTQRYLWSAKFKRDSARAKVIKDEDIDFSDIPKLTDEELARMTRPKQQLTIRLDADIVDWLKSQKGPYQSRLNALLRMAMELSR
jgi:uncharacterized protein (DUF4415 family)